MGSGIQGAHGSHRTGVDKEHVAQGMHLSWDTEPMGRSSLVLCERGLFFGLSSSHPLCQFWGKKCPGWGF